MTRLGLIVEGHGETVAVPLLVRRIAHGALGRFDTGVHRTIRVKRGLAGATNSTDLDRSVTLLARDGCESILVLLDSDDDCPAILAPALLATAKPVAAHVKLGVVLAHREFEAWFLAALTSLRGVRAMPSDASFDRDPESVRGAKRAFEALFKPGNYYSETVDQPSYTAAFDLDEARRNSPSFDKFYREVERLTAP
ncbi:MAG TPA: DUF4276 family protein [Acidimicrobiales bacterium]|jgi:hypothetical protein|nr:DUF4276 family protein [Acidimicrobiales bacterium]